MTIKIFTDRIDIGDFTLFEGNGGVQFDGVARAENFLGNQSFQGSVAGFATLGQSNSINKFPFASDSNAVQHGTDTVTTRYDMAGQSSTTHGYSCGGVFPGPNARLNTIVKFLFASNANATDVGDMTIVRGGSGAAGQSSTTHGYNSGGYFPGTTSNVIDKFLFATDSNATDVGDMTIGRSGPTGQSSTTHGYVSTGSYNNGPATGVNNRNIDKFPFATNSNATLAGLSLEVDSGGTVNGTGQSSATHGYISGGQSRLATNTNVVQKFSFSTDGNSVDMSDLTQTKTGPAGQSSTVSGYTSGGLTPTPANVNTIDKFPFATDSNATDVGDLTTTASENTGQQV